LPSKTKIILVQLGSPRSPQTSDVRRYLKEFLGDPRVVDLPPLLWKIILYLFILPFRPARSAKLYQRIWDGKGFPLVEGTKRFAQRLQEFFDPQEIEVQAVFLLSSPRFSDLWDQWLAQIPQKTAAQKWFIVPLFPQYSESTSASVFDQFFKELEKRALIPAFEVLPYFHHSRAFIDQSVQHIENTLQQYSEKPQHLLLSFHGIPKRRVLFKGDPYYRHCYETYFLIQERIQSLKPSQISWSFQSRFGSEEWLIPYTSEKVKTLVAQGDSFIAVYCPSFVTDCLETLDEIGHELAKETAALGGKIALIPCLNEKESWCKAFAEFLRTHICESQKNKELAYYPLDEKVSSTMPEPQMESPPLSTETKKTLKIVFLTLFLDLIGFSIIFPLFPEILKHYSTQDPENFFFKSIMGLVSSWTSLSGKTQLGMEDYVLFGGILGALYSFLQFLAAPFWGTLSDRIGRRPVLLFSVAGLALSYLLWFFSGSFTLLVLARLVGGLMGGNISTATAVVADITPQASRSKGMAIIGIAFALGFILGPALGGISSLFDLRIYFPQLVSYGLNPFSAPALLAFCLSVFNFFLILRKFKETLPPEKRGQASTDRSINPFTLFRPLPYPGVHLTNIGHFLFLTAFSGMEFTLTFLALERLQYRSLENAYMFIFIGFIIAFVQGGVVRRKAHQVGEKKMALMGLFCLIPGLLLIGFAFHSAVLYLGLFFLALGSAMAIPCLTSLISLYSPPEYQGKSIGIFRSLGALARVIGPLTAALLYWRLGSQWAYLLGTGFLLLPILLISRLPAPSKTSS
jgi:ferrochelatase